MEQFKSLKFKISSPEQSERLQEVLREMCYQWSAGNNVQYTEKPFLYANDDGYICHGKSLEFFEQEASKEKDTEAFILKHSQPSYAKNKWHSVVDALPDSHLTDYLVVCENDPAIMMAYFADGKWWSSRDYTCFNNDVTHWRELPKGPTE